MKAKLTFRVIEMHTIEREVDDAELKSAGDPTDFLGEKFQNDPLSDSNYYTESMELLEWRKA